MKTMKNKMTGEISYIEEKEWEDGRQKLTKYKKCTEKADRRELEEWR